MANWYSEVLGNISGLRRGITTGTCAQAAAKAALQYLLYNKKPESIEISLPDSRETYSSKKIQIPVYSACIKEQTGTAQIRKDAGDDNDCTDGLLIGASVTLTDDGKISINGGKGVGKVTRKGTANKIGEPAINPVPRKMIKKELFELLKKTSRTKNYGCRVIIFVPEGKKIALQTWNPRIGITGGISIIGTKGVVEPKSEQSYKKSILAVIKNYQDNNVKDFFITPGYVGEKYLSSLDSSQNNVVTTGDHIGFTLSEIMKQKTRSITLVGHIGKLCKIAAGIFNTHWKSGDARLEIIAAYAAYCGAGTEIIKKILSLSLAEEALSLISANNLEETYTQICKRIVYRMDQFIALNSGYKCQTGCVLLNLSAKALAIYPKELKINLSIN